MHATKEHLKNTRQKQYRQSTFHTSNFCSFWKKYRQSTFHTSNFCSFWKKYRQSTFHTSNFCSLLRCGTTRSKRSMPWTNWSWGLWWWTAQRPCSIVWKIERFFNSGISNSFQKNSHRQWFGWWSWSSTWWTCQRCQRPFGVWNCSLAMAMSRSRWSMDWCLRPSSTLDTHGNVIKWMPSTWLLQLAWRYEIAYSLFFCGECLYGDCFKDTPKCQFIRLCIWVLLNTDASGFFLLLAVVCTTFSAINVATSRRTPSTPFGDTSLQYVRVSWLFFMFWKLSSFPWWYFSFHCLPIAPCQEGNMLLARSILLCYLCMALGGTWMIEQPASSRLPWFPRFEKMLLKVRAWRVGWWARHYGALTPMLGSWPAGRFFWPKCSTCTFPSGNDIAQGKGIEDGPTARRYTIWTEDA